MFKNVTPEQIYKDVIDSYERLKVTEELVKKQLKDLESTTNLLKIFFEELEGKHKKYSGLLYLNEEV